MSRIEDPLGSERYEKDMQVVDAYVRHDSHPTNSNGSSETHILVNARPTRPSQNAKTLANAAIDVRLPFFIDNNPIVIHRFLPSSGVYLSCVIMSTKKDDSAKPLQSAPPPWHSVALVGFLIAVFSAMLPSLEAIDHDATVETFTNRKFPDYISLQVLGWIRCAFAFLAFSTSYWTSCIDTVG